MDHAGRKRGLPGILLPELSSDHFRNLRICGLLKSRCFLAQNGRVRVYLELSDDPPLGWSYILFTLYHGAEPQQVAKIGIESDAIWIECHAASFESLQLPIIQQRIAEANAVYRKALREQNLAHQQRDQKNNEVLDQIRSLDLGFTPRKRRKRQTRILRAYLKPLLLYMFCLLWCASGVWVSERMARAGVGLISYSLAMVAWIGVLWSITRRAIAHFKRRFKIRRLIRRKHSEILWPDLYVDRRSGV